MPLYCYEHITDFVFRLSYLMHFTRHNCQIVLWGDLRYKCEDYQDQRETQLCHLPAVQPHDSTRCITILYLQVPQDKNRSAASII